MDTALNSVKQEGFKGADAYIDNILIFTPTIEEHFVVLERVFQALQEHNLTLRSDKCEFGYSEINFLGFLIDGERIKPTPENVEKLLRIPEPKTKKQIQRFLGVANFNRRFIPNYATLSKPLTRILSNTENFIWEEEQQSAFSNIKKSLVNAENLALPDWSLPFHIHTDASGVASGATLSQMDKTGNQKIIAYHSKTFNKCQTRWSTTERELFGIVDACRKWKLYCNGKVHIHTDHKPLQHIKTQKDPRGKIGRWLIELDSIDCEIHYIAGDENVVPDFLSRDILMEPKIDDYELDSDDMIFTAEESQPFNVQQQQKQDKNVRHAVNQLLKKGKVTNGIYRNFSGLTVDGDGLLRKGERIVIPDKLIPSIIHNVHGQCHPGIEITLATIRNYFWWKNMNRDVKSAVGNCRSCLQTKNIQNPKAEIKSVIIPEIPREVLSIDIATMPWSGLGNRYFLVMVDMHTKFAAVAPLKDQTAPQIAQALWQHWFSKFGLPSILISDQGRNVDGNVVRKLCKELRIEKRHSSPYHPQGNSSSERMIGAIKSRVSSILNSRNMSVSTWDLVIQEAVLYINNQVNSSLKYSPFMLTFGNTARTPIENYYGLPSPRPLCHCGIGALLGDATLNKHEAAEAYQQQANKSPNVNDFAPGERVLVKRSFGSDPKVSVKWMDGPYYIDRKVGPVNWAVRDDKGNAKCLHHDKIKKAGSMMVATKTPSSDTKAEATNCITMPRETAPISVTIPLSNPSQHQNHINLQSTMDTAAFSDRVQSHPESASSSDTAPTVTRSGRVSRPVMGTRLIDNRDV